MEPARPKRFPCRWAGGWVLWSYLRCGSCSCGAITTTIAIITFHKRKTLWCVARFFLFGVKKKIVPVVVYMDLCIYKLARITKVRIVGDIISIKAGVELKHSGAKFQIWAKLSANVECWFIKENLPSDRTVNLSNWCAKIPAKRSWICYVHVH